MGQVINLNKVRKAKSKAAKSQLAAENRVRFGLTKAEKQQARREAEDAAKKLDGHHLVPKDESSQCC